MSKHIIGIDIGSSKVCAIAGTVDQNGRLQITSVASSKCDGIKNSEIVDIDEICKAVSICKAQLDKNLDESISRVFLCIPMSICEFQNNRGVVSIYSEKGLVTAKDITKALDSAKLITVSEDMEIVDAISQEFYIDGYKCLKNPVGINASRFEVDAKVILAKKDTLYALIKSINKAGLKVEAAVLQPIASSLATLSKEDKRIGTAIIDVGAESIDISVYKSSKLCYTSSMILGGNNITKDLSLCLKMPFNNAENLKLKYGIIQDSQKRKESIKIKTSYEDIVDVKLDILSQIIEARVEQILQIIRSNLEKNKIYDNITNIVLVGGGIALFKGIVEISERILGLPVKIGIPKYVSVSSPLYANAIGILEDVRESLKDRFIEDTFEEEVQISENDYSPEEGEEEKSKNGIIVKIKEFFEDFF